MKLVLIRGIVGTGKSTHARLLLSTSSEHSTHIEADMFWMLKDGSYNFDMKKIAYAHKWCLAKTAEAFQKEIDNVIVSNTFTTIREMQPYIDLAKDYNVPVSIVEMKTQYQNIHNVPEDVLIKMKNRWEEIPSYWDVTKEVIKP